MKYLYLFFRRCYWTLICKFSANMAEKFPKLTGFVFILDFALKKLSDSLSSEATFCMKKIGKWQNKAKVCVLAHHANEKILKPKNGV